MRRGLGSRAIPGLWWRFLTDAVDGVVLRPDSQGSWSVEWREWGRDEDGSPIDCLDRCVDDLLTAGDAENVLALARPNRTIEDGVAYLTRDSIRALAVALGRVYGDPHVVADFDCFCEPWPLGSAPKCPAS
jgi:hypothetical protein